MKQHIAHHQENIKTELYVLGLFVQDLCELRFDERGLEGALEGMLECYEQAMIHAGEISRVQGDY